MYVTLCTTGHDPGEFGFSEQCPGTARDVPVHPSHCYVCIEHCFGTYEYVIDSYKYVHVHTSMSMYILVCLCYKLVYISMYLICSSNFVLH